MSPSPLFFSSVNGITELFLSIADGVEIHPCPLTGLPREEQEHD